MNAQGFGHVGNISSIAGLQVMPTAAVYCATKFAVRAISDGLRQENAGIRVTCIYPGLVKTDLANSISDEAVRTETERAMVVSLEPEAIANAILYAVSQPADVDVTEIVVRSTPSPI